MKADIEGRIFLFGQMVDGDYELSDQIRQLPAGLLDILLTKDIIPAELVIGIGDKIKDLVIQFKALFKFGEKNLERDCFLFLATEKPTDPVNYAHSLLFHNYDISMGAAPPFEQDPDKQAGGNGNGNGHDTEKK